MNNKPLVSIIMPAHNAGKYIEEAIQSFLAQTYDNKELIVIDDASNDQTSKIIKFHSRMNSHIKHTRNQKKLGIAKSRNIALDLAQGEFIGHLDADDKIIPNAIEKMIRAFKSKEIGYVYSGYIVSDRSLNEIGRVSPDTVSSIVPLGWRHFGMYRRKAAINTGRFNEKLRHCEDGELVVRMMKRYKSKKVPNFFYYARRHDKNISSTIPPCKKCPQNNVCAFVKEATKLRNKGKLKRKIVRFINNILERK